MLNINAILEEISEIWIFENNSVPNKSSHTFSHIKHALTEYCYTNTDSDKSRGHELLSLIR